jgi:hypothetical protein
MLEKKLDIKKKYSHELLDIENRLRDLEQNRIYELSGARMDGYLATNIIKLREKINELIEKIEYDAPSTAEILSEAIRKVKL